MSCEVFVKLLCRSGIMPGRFGRGLGACGWPGAFGGFSDAKSGLRIDLERFTGHIWVDLTVDLFGEQTVQVATAILQAACVLLATIAVVLWSVRTAASGRIVPVRAHVPRLARLASMDVLNRRPSDQAFCSSLPARAPPFLFPRSGPVRSPGIVPGRLS